MVVSNSPCGVESYEGETQDSHVDRVSNSPCGVESEEILQVVVKEGSFLIHRVEFKER